MSNGKRILIVEDHPDVLETYRKSVARAGFLVDTATTKEEAFEKIRRRTYHVAMIDVNLTDYSGGDGNDRSGIDLVRKIKALKEGTHCIVISGEKSSEVPVDAQEAGYDKYIIKKRIRGPEDYLNPVRELANSCTLAFTGEFKDLTAYLAFPQMRLGWESFAMHALKCDAATLSKTLNEAFVDYLPVLRQRNAQGSLVPIPERNQIAGAFWSRALGRAIWVALAPKGVTLDDPARLYGASEALGRRSKGAVNFGIWGVDKPARGDFFELIDDLRQ